MKKHIPFPVNQFLPKKIHTDTCRTLYERGLVSKEQVRCARLLSILPWVWGWLRS